MKTYGTICDCGNTKETTEKMCSECKRLEENNKSCHIRNMTCWSKDRIPTIMPRISFARKRFGGGWR